MAQTKKQKMLAEKLGDNQGLHGFDDALKLLRELKTTKFDETVEVSLNLGVDPRHADQMVRGMVVLPSGTGKDVKVAVFARGDNAQKALDAGADKVGAEDLLEDMQNGNLDYGRVIATPDMMGLVGRLGKVTRKQLEDIVKAKEADLTAADMEAAVRTIAGSARSMGLVVEG